MKTVGKNIRLLRQQQGWSQDDISKRLNISIPAFSKIETGVTDINLSRLEQIAGVFGISVIQLLTLNQPAEEQRTTELVEMNQKLSSRETEVINLQKKVIQLFEELRLQG